MNTNSFPADPGRLHFVGVAGSGMSALAQYRALGGHATSGSDRAFDRGEQARDRKLLESVGVRIFPQDGSAISGSRRIVTSTAVESRIPDLVAARELYVPVIHRAELLAEHVCQESSVAIAGTSGKSTVTAMVFHVLQHAGLDPGLITGGDLVSLRDRGLRGNAWRGSGPLVVEADESDGSLVHHAPGVSVLLNLHRDHMEEEGVMEQFRTLRDRTQKLFLVSDAPELRELRPGSTVFGFSPDAGLRGVGLETAASETTFVFGGHRIRVPLPGRHNAENALAALAVAHALGAPMDRAAEAVSSYRGVVRRFQVLGCRGGITVVDDYAHNPTKIVATIDAARAGARRVFAFFQPHGFGPARFMRSELNRLLPPALRPEDRLYVGEIFFTGGTVTRDISSRDIVEDLRQEGCNAVYVEDKQDLSRILLPDLQPGDLVVIMGARDPALTTLANRVLASLGRRECADPLT